MTLVTQSPGSLATATHPPSLLHALSYIALVLSIFDRFDDLLFGPVIRPEGRGRIAAILRQLFSL